MMSAAGSMSCYKFRDGEGSVYKIKVLSLNSIYGPHSRTFTFLSMVSGMSEKLKRSLENHLLVNFSLTHTHAHKHEPDGDVDSSQRNLH